MKTFIAALLAGALLFSFGGKVFAADSDRKMIVSDEKDRTVRPAVEAPKTQRYVCPSTRSINCMPPVKESNRRWCDPEYLKWAGSNCSGLKIVY